MFYFCKFRPLIGCGNFADKFCAVSGTGRGEAFIRYSLHFVCSIRCSFDNTMTTSFSYMKESSWLSSCSSYAGTLQSVLKFSNDNVLLTCCFLL